MQSSNMNSMNSKEIKNILLFGFICVIIIICLTYLFIPKNKNDNDNIDNNSNYSFIPGVYTSSINLNNIQPIILQVKVDKNSIEQIMLTNIPENLSYFYPSFKSAIDEIANHIITNQNFNISNTENPITYEIILNCIDSAIKQARQ